MLVTLSNDEIVQLATRAKVQALEVEMKKLPQVECPLFHHFMPGMYVRELHIPRDALTVGKIHKFPCLNFLTKGERTTLIDERMVRIQGSPYPLVPTGTPAVLVHS